MPDKKQYLAVNSDYELSITKISGKEIKDIVGFVSGQFTTPVFVITKIIFEDDTCIRLKGEHDIALFAG